MNSADPECDSCCDGFKVDSVIEFLFETREWVSVGGESPSVEDGGALLTGLYQTCGCKNLQMVCHIGLSDVEDLAELSHTEGLVSQYAQDLQSQFISAGFADDQKVSVGLMLWQGAHL